MTREVKFRGKRVDNGEWLYGNYIKRWCGTKHKHYINDRLYDYEVDPETVGEYTNFCDKNSKEIYEGDIVRHEEGLNHIVFKDGAYKAEYILSFDWQTNDSYTVDELQNCCEIIGNIYENPELLAANTSSE